MEAPAAGSTPSTPSARRRRSKRFPERGPSPPMVAGLRLLRKHSGPMRPDAKRILERLSVTVPAGGGEQIESIDPATGAPQGRIPAVTRAEYDDRVGVALRRFEEWRMRPAPKRGELVRRLGELLREHKEPLGELVSLETGKIRAE